MSPDNSGIEGVSRHAPSPDPPLPYEDAPPLPNEALPEDDGWEPRWDYNTSAYYFFNRFTQVSQWENPRVPEAAAAKAAVANEIETSYNRYAHPAAPGTTNSAGAPGTYSPPKRRAGGYNPAIHGSYDPTADYAVEAQKKEEEDEAAAASAAAVAAGLPDPNEDYTATGTFNRFTGRFQSDQVNPENHNDEAKSRRQLGAFFDVDAAANVHDGRSLKAERRNQTLSKKQLKAYKEKRRDRKEEKRRAWLRD
ncbi:hypothetical protein B0J11DRAFT_426412 [Dendryphion nanum]|uniref:WW domain-containing protein n=1 Tax=Dendryphion nanum TaxID=256645 RepID=A0A9P9EDS0_9PLEO|nr:hypothetical protein B0J11DRAFT_426412 [Dendryphion nanum]